MNKVDADNFESLRRKVRRKPKPEIVNFTVRIPKDHHEVILGLVGGGFYTSKSEVVRYAIKLLVDSIVVKDIE